MLNSMIAAPFLALPALKEVNKLEGEALDHFLEERKKNRIRFDYCLFRNPY